MSNKNKNGSGTSKPVILTLAVILIVALGSIIYSMKVDGLLSRSSVSDEYVDDSEDDTKPDANAVSDNEASENETLDSLLEELQSLDNMLNSTK